MHCNHCGAPNLGPRDPLCSRCGAPVDATILMERIDRVQGQIIEAAPSWTRGDQPRLVVLQGPNSGASFLVHELMVLGRRDDSDIILDDISVSRRHAMVVPNGPALTVEDLGSLNGTYIDDRRIEAATTAAHGQALLVGRYRLIVIGGADYESDRQAGTT